MSRPVFVVSSHGKAPACMLRTVFVGSSHGKGASLYVTHCACREFT